MKARPEQDQRPQRRRDDCRDDLRDRGQVGIVVVLGGDEYPKYDVRDRGPRPRTRSSSSHTAPLLPGQRREVCRAVVPDPSDQRPNDRIERHILRRPPGFRPRTRLAGRTDRIHRVADKHRGGARRTIFDHGSHASALVSINAC